MGVFLFSSVWSQTRPNSCATEKHLWLCNLLTLGQFMFAFFSLFNPVFEKPNVFQNCGQTTKHDLPKSTATAVLLDQEKCQNCSMTPILLFNLLDIKAS